MIAQAKSLKINFNGDIKRFALPNTYDELLIALSKSFGFSKDDIMNLTISYTDNEGDLLLLSDDYDYDQAKLLMEKESIDVLKITLERIETLKPNHEKSYEIINERNYELQNTIYEKPPLVDETTITLFTQQHLVKSEFLVPEQKNFDTKPVQDVATNTEREDKSSGSKAFDAGRKRMKTHKHKYKHKCKHNMKSIEYHKEVARRRIKKVVNRELRSVKKAILAKAFEKSDEMIEKIIKEQTVRTEIKNSSVHENVRCTGCKIKPIVGNRYRCSVCENFDYCEACEEIFSSEHEHLFLKIRSPDRNPLKINNVFHSKSDDTRKNNNCVANIKKNIACYWNQIAEYVKINEVMKEAAHYEFYFEKMKQKLAEVVTKRSMNEIELGPELDISSSCLTSNLLVEIVEHTQLEVRKTIKLCNNGKFPWPKPCYFSCLTDLSSVHGKAIPVQVKVDPGKEINVEVTFKLNAIRKEGDYHSIWQLQNEKMENFGDQVSFVVRVKCTGGILINPEYVELPKEIFSFGKDRKLEKILEELKAEYDLKEVSEKKLMTALAMADGNKETALEILCSSQLN